MLDLATRCDRFILILANQTIAGDRLKIGDRSHSTNVSPDTFDREEAFQQKLVSYVGKDATDVDVEKPAWIGA